MREIKVLRWTELTSDGKSRDVSTIELIKILLNNRDPNKTKKGMDQYRFLRRVDVACKSAEKENILKLDEIDYSQIRTIIEEEIPPSWGMNGDIFNAIEGFLNAERSKG